MSRDDSHKNEVARAGARRLIEQTPKALAGLAVVSGVAYLAGSIYTRAYFSEFGASWILEELPAATYFSQSWVPLVLMLYFGYLATTNLAVMGSPEDWTASSKFKFSLALVQYGAWFLLALLVMTPLLTTFGYVTPAIVLSIVGIAAILLVFSSALELVVARFKTMDRLIDISMAYVAFAVIAAGLYVVPAQLGLNWARIDKQPTSSLLTVYLHSDAGKEYRLLFSVGERVYVFPARFEGPRPPVQATAIANVAFVPPEK
ncbi:MAG: hypothetical protein A4E19_12785 [Nitrospira sp. SG-bin1]|nr:MAG: hypothetical protein A4E19_12785 [Nitrospira sp. SG-bin1]